MEENNLRQRGYGGGDVQMVEDGVWYVYVCMCVCMYYLPPSAILKRFVGKGVVSKEIFGFMRLRL